MYETTSSTADAIAGVTAFYNEMRVKARPLVDKFETRYAAWMQTSENTAEQEDKFVKLVGMGVKILPLIIRKLCSKTEATAVTLCKLVGEAASLERLVREHGQGRAHAELLEENNGKME